MDFLSPQWCDLNWSPWVPFEASRQMFRQLPTTVECTESVSRKSPAWPISGRREGICGNGAAHLPSAPWTHQCHSTTRIRQRPTCGPGMMPQGISSSAQSPATISMMLNAKSSNVIYYGSIGWKRANLPSAITDASIRNIGSPGTDQRETEADACR